MSSNRKPLVFVPNKNNNDFSAAREFGELIFLTEGPISRFAVTALHKTLRQKLEQAEAHDYLMITSLNIITAIATGILVSRFQRANFLIYSQTDGYTARSVTFEP